MDIKVVMCYQFFPNKQSRNEERIIGGSYKNVFVKGVLSYLKPNSKVMEFEPGASSWSHAIWKYIPDGKLTTLDFQDVRPWFKPEKYNTRLKCIQIVDNSFTAVTDNSFHVFTSFGVLCHNNASSNMEILQNSFSKMKTAVMRFRGMAIGINWRNGVG